MPQQHLHRRAPWLFAGRLVAATIVGPEWVQAQRPLDRAALAVTHVTVIDVAGGATHPDQTLVVVGNRIARLGPSATTAARS